MWYRDKIGKIVNLVREDRDTFWSREDAGYLNVVKRTDAEIVEIQCCNGVCNQGRTCPLQK